MNLNFLKSDYVNRAAIAKNLYPELSPTSAQKKFINKLNGVQNRSFSDEEREKLLKLKKEIKKTLN